ncbi:MAG: plastocyanin/azurin family copper-binding protein, partial [Nitrosopumilus sp.]
APEPESAPEPEPESAPEPIVTAPVSAQTHRVTPSEGSGTPGCEETNECFIPYTITINVGDAVQWENIDTAAHTVTSGNISDGHDGLFDSGLLMSGETFEFTFDEAGTYDYFCMVHPWMNGVIQVS